MSSFWDFERHLQAFVRDSFNIPVVVGCWAMYNQDILGHVGSPF